MIGGGTYGAAADFCAVRAARGTAMGKNKNGGKNKKVIVNYVWFCYSIFIIVGHISVSGLILAVWHLRLPVRSNYPL